MPRSTALGSGGDPLIWLGLAAATLFFVATGAVAYLNFQTLKHDSALVVRSGDTLTALEDVLSTVRDAETGQRGYLLTDKESYLGPYNAAAQEIGPRFDMLRRLTIDDPAQQDRLATLKQHIDAKLAELKQTIDLRQTQGQAAALAVVQSDRGKQDMDAIRDQVSAMEQEEIDLRAKRLAEMADAYWRAIAQRHHLQPTRTWPNRRRGLSDRSLGSRPTPRGLASDGSRRALEGDARRPADQPARRQHSGLPVPISRRSCRRCFLQRQKRPLSPDVDLWRPRRCEDPGSFRQRRRAARPGGRRGPINSRPRRPGGLSRHRFGVRGRQAAAPGCRPGNRRRVDERRAGVRIRPPPQ